MATDVEIANLALAHLGENGTVTKLEPPTGTAQAIHCARFFFIARDALQAAYPWNFCTRRITPAEMTPEPGAPYQFAYQLPPNAVHVFAVQPPGAHSDNVSVWDEGVLSGYAVGMGNVQGAQAVPKNFVMETLQSGQKVIYTNVENPVVRYAIRVTDTSKFDPLFTMALARLLASYVAGPIIKGQAGRNEAKFQYQMFRQEVGLAQITDANQSQQVVNHVPMWMSNR